MKRHTLPTWNTLLPILVHGSEYVYWTNLNQTMTFHPNLTGFSLCLMQNGHMVTSFEGELFVFLQVFIYVQLSLRYVSHRLSIGKMINNSSKDILLKMRLCSLTMVSHPIFSIRLMNGMYFYHGGCAEKHLLYIETYTRILLRWM